MSAINVCCAFIWLLEMIEHSINCYNFLWVLFKLWVIAFDITVEIWPVFVTLLYLYVRRASIQSSLCYFIGPKDRKSFLFNQWGCNANCNNGFSHPNCVMSRIQGRSFNQMLNNGFNWNCLMAVKNVMDEFFVVVAT